jgi:ribosomal protein S18 acetylase RimI-like enzyme
MASAQAAAAGADRTHVDPVLWRGGNIVAAQMSARIRQATLADVDAVTPLLDAYRQFYGEPSDVALARSFMTERLQRQESIVLLALDDNNAVAGFTQLYPGFSSNRLARIYLLNDLFVVPAARRRGIAAALLTEAAATCRTRGAARLTLVTARTNIPAQKLYEACGWIRDETFCDYALSL